MDFASIASLAAVAGYLANQVIDTVKPLIKDRLPESNRDSVVRIMSLVVMIVCALVVGIGAFAAGYITEGQILAILLATLPATGGWYQLDSRRQAAKEMARNAFLLEEDIANEDR